METHHGAEIYTDGSRTAQGVSASFVVKNGAHTISEYMLMLQMDNSHSQADMLAIQETLRWILRHDKNRYYDI